MSEDPNALSDQLCEASRKGCAETVMELLEGGVSPDATLNGRTALYHAAQFGRDHAHVVEALLDAGADPNAPWVVEECGVRSLPLILAAGGSIDGNPSRVSPLIVAIVGRTKQDKALALLSLGANPNSTDSNGTTALMHAVINGRDQAFRSLIERGADACLVDSTGRSALRYGLETLCRANAATDSDARRTKGCVKYLLSLLPAQPEDVILADIVLGNQKELEKRLRGGLNANAMIAGALGVLTISRDTLEEKLAEQLKSKSIVETILTDQPQLDAIAGGTPLLVWAIAAKQLACIATLLAHGADPELMNSDGVSPFTFSNHVGIKPEIRSLIRNALR